ncbi:glycosyltransferase family 2 protein [Hymenobacter terrenus]|uniref:glycosyltransferase family 2 protein n=1 Tax=Hymenobacter terrenus TaxID=1629124 RepID=UPI0006197926|nr:glycosyltransferase family 2 protein [Hymenobacter terrenus]
MAPGLSVLIPVFNWDVNELVHSLVAQRAAWGGSVEIILFDDGSREEFRAVNRPLAAQPGVRYHELPQNVGRAAIRNQLAAVAQHEWLLLLDNDSRLPDNQFLARYAAARDQARVLIGGTCYEAAPPADAALYLRWLYGQAREARPAAVRQVAPYSQLTINNALIRADIFQQFSLDERLTGYGHEDTKFGVELAGAGVPVLHISNPVLHDGLEPAPIFLQKSEQAVHNLALVFRQDGLGTDSRLLRLALRLHRLGLASATRAALAAIEPRLRRNLLSAKPNLRGFDLLKLHWLLPLL